MTAPRILFAVMGCLNNHHAGKMMIMGVKAINVLATPAAVYCTASNEHPTPTNGPKIVVITAATIPLRSRTPFCNGLKPSVNHINNVNPMTPATQRKKLAWKGNSQGSIDVVNEAS